MPRTPRPLLLSLTVLGLALPACGGSPPRELGGFGLHMSQEQVVVESRGRGASSCTLTGTRPRLTVCEGFEPGEQYRVVVLDDTTTSIRLRMAPDGRRPERELRRFARTFGDPAWRERPAPMPGESARGYHTLWLDRDSSRALALTCRDRRLVPPCYAELTRTSPAAIEATLDSLLNIRR